MAKHAHAQTRKPSPFLIFVTFLGVGACVSEPKTPTSGDKKDAGRDVSKGSTVTTAKGGSGGNTAGTGGTGGGSAGASTTKTGGNTAAGGSVGGSAAGGSIAGGSGGIPGGNGGMTGAGTGGIVAADAAVDSGTPGLMGIGGFAPYKTGPRTGGGSFYCPRTMLFSPEMNQAAVDDAKRYNWPVASFYYGVATLNGAPCCSCWQLVFDKPREEPEHLPVPTYDPPRPLIIQMFNTAGNDGAFDLYLGKGGMGNFQRQCPAMYEKFPLVGEVPWLGGIRASFISECGKAQATLASQACVDAVAKACNEIVGKSEYVTTVTRNSCIVGNTSGTLYHENWWLKARRVKCPQALTEVTGCRLKEGNDLPAPDPAIQTAAQAASWPRWTAKEDYSTTTMQDCCVPTCANPGSVGATENGYSGMYVCDDKGKVMAN